MVTHSLYIIIIFCILFGNIDWLKTGHMTFYKKCHSTDVANYRNTYAIYKFIFRNIRAIHDLSMYFPKFQQISKISTNFKNFKNFRKFQKINKISKFLNYFKISKISKNFKISKLKK